MSDSGHMSGEEETEDFKEQDRFLPIANVARIMKKALPENAKIAKEAKECVQECVSDFISFITSEASDRCQQEKRKTINGEDILWAMQSLGFENYAEALKIYLAKYRETTKIERSSANTKEKEGSSGENVNVVFPTSSQQQHPQQHPGVGGFYPVPHQGFLGENSQSWKKKKFTAQDVPFVICQNNYLIVSFLIRGFGVVIKGRRKKSSISVNLFSGYFTLDRRLSLLLMKLNM